MFQPNITLYDEFRVDGGVNLGFEKFGGRITGGRAFKAMNTLARRVRDRASPSRT